MPVRGARTIAACQGEGNRGISGLHFYDIPYFSHPLGSILVSFLVALTNLWTVLGEELCEYCTGYDALASKSLLDWL